MAIETEAVRGDLGRKPPLELRPPQVAVCANASYEPRTPLNAIIGLTEMMVTNPPRFEPKKAHEPLNP